MKPTDILKEEHQVIKRMLKVIEIVSDKLDAGEEISPEVLERIGEEKHHEYLHLVDRYEEGFLNSPKEDTVMAEKGRVVTLDVRDLSPWERHPRIFETFDNLAVGEVLKLINDHDPRPLHYELMHEREGLFEWNSEEKAPREWVALIEKKA